MTGFSGTIPSETVNDKIRREEKAGAERAAAIAAAAPRTAVQIEADRMAARQQKTTATALSRYREFIVILAAGKPLSQKQSDEFQAVVDTLGITAKDVASDEEAIRQHALHTSALATVSTELADLEQQSKNWQTERESLNKRLRDIEVSSARLMALAMGSGSSRAELDRITKQHSRVFGG